MVTNWAGKKENEVNAIQYSLTEVGQLSSMKMMLAVML